MPIVGALGEPPSLGRAVTKEVLQVGTLSQADTLVVSLHDTLLISSFQGQVIINV